MAVDLAELGISVRSDGVLVANKRLKEMERQSGKTEKATERLARKADAMGRSMTSMGRTLTTRVTAPLLAIAGAAAKMGASFDSELTKINTLVGVGREEIAGYREEILRLAPALGQQPQQMASALFAVTSAGARGAAAMQTLEAASKAAAIGLGDSRSVALAATAAVKAYGTENLNASQAVEILVGTIEQGNVAAEQVAPVLGRVIGIAAELGVTFDEVGGFIASFTRLGVDAAEATTALRGALSVLQRPTKETRDTFDALGMSVEGFRNQIREAGFTNAMQELVDRSRELNVDLSALFPNVRALSGILGVFGGEAGEAQKIAEGVAAAIGTLDDRFQAMIEQDPAFAFEQMKAELSSLLIEISANILPAALDLMQSVRDMAQAFRNLSPETQRLIVQFGAWAAAIGPLLIVFGSLIRSLSAISPILFGGSGLIKGFGLLTRSMKQTTSMAAVMKAGLGGAAATMGTLSFAVGALIGYKLQDAFKEWADGAQSIGEQLRDLTPKMDRFTGSVARMREQFLRSQLDQAKAELEALERVINDVGARSRLGVTQGQLEAARERVRELNEQLDINAKRWEAHNQRVIEASNNIGAWGSNTASAIQIAMNMADQAAASMGGVEQSQSKAREASADWRRELDELEAQLAGPMAQANMEFAQRIEDINKRFADGEGDIKQWARAITLARMALEHARNDARSQGVFGVDFGSTDAALDALDAIADKMREIADIEWGLDALADSFDPLVGEMRRLGEEIELLDHALNEGVISNAEAGFLKIGATANAAFGAMMQGVSRTSKEYEDLQRAQQIVNVAMGIAAILQQGMGDPYTAIPRMVAMAAMVASLGVNTGRLSGGGAAQRQQTQGTGTVLGDAEAKSESIVNATEITADATSALVGINRSMLRALEGLQDRIAGASGQIARGAGQLDVSGIDLGRTFFEDVFATFDPLGFAIDSFIGGLFGFGKTKVKDQGIALLGGLIVDLTEGAVAQAFADLKRKSIFGNKSKTVFEDLDDEFNTQLNLIFQSLIDTVTAAGEALGIPLDELEARIATFEVEAQKISLKGLSAEEQQAELEAVFGAIFDGLAGHVVPFIGQFQQVGEGLGETLVRVASSVQVVEEALKRLGFQAERTGVEQFAQLSVALVEAAGGLNEFIEGMSAFMQHFAPEAHQLTVMGESLASAFEQVGLTLPTTREELWALMQTLDANTEAGREQIATLLELAGMADAFYSALEDATRDYANAVQGVEEALVLDGLSDFQREMVGIQRELMQTIDAMNSAARAAGLQGAREEDLARAHELAAIRAQQAIARLESQAEEWVGELFGTSLSEITAQVNEAQAAFESLQSQLQQLSDFADSLLIGQFSPLPSGQRLAEAMAQLEAASAAGDVSGVQSIAQTVLQIARDRFASGQQFTDIFNEVQDIIRGTDPADSVQGVSIISAPGLAPLLRQQSQLEQEAEDRREQMLANDIAQAVADLAMATGDSFDDVANRLGFDLQDLGDVLGLNEQELANFIESLQVDTGDIATHLETLGDRIVAAILEGRDISDPIDDRSVDSRTGGLAGDPIDERDIDSRFGGQAGERDVESITDSQGETTRAVEDASRDIRGSMETPAERAERMALLRRIAEAQEARSGGRNVRTRSAA